MNAAIIDRPGAVPRFAEFRDPDSVEGREIVDLVAAGIHPLVRKLAAGEHYLSDGIWPAIPGVDVVARTPDGRLVYTGFVEPPFGTFADRISVPAGMMLPLPAGADPAVIAAGMNPGLSSWPILATAGALDLVVVVGATGAAGRLAIQNARHLGARAIVAIGRNGDALAGLACEGVRPVTLSSDRETDGRTIAAAFGRFDRALVLDYVWGTVAESVFAALMGPQYFERIASVRYVQIGDGAGAETRIPAELLRSRPIQIVGSGAGSVSIPEIVKQVPVYAGMLARGEVMLDVARYPLNEIATAWAHRDSSTRVVVTHSV